MTNPLYREPARIYGSDYNVSLDTYYIFSLKKIYFSVWDDCMVWQAKEDPIARFDGKTIPSARPYTGKNRGR